MAKPKRDLEERMTMRSMLAAAVVAVVDHRVLFQLAVVCFAVFVLRVFGPDEIVRDIDYVVSSVPARLVGQAVARVRGLAIGGLEKVDEATRPIDAASLGTPASAPSDPPGTGAGIATSGSGIRPDQPQPRESIDKTLEHTPRVAHAAIDRSVSSGSPVGANGTSEAPETVLWSLVNDEETIRAELHHQSSSGGVDLLLFKNGRLWRSERWADRAAARAEADRKRADLEKSGWRRPDCCGSPGVPDF